MNNSGALRKNTDELNLLVILYVIGSMNHAIEKWIISKLSRIYQRTYLLVMHSVFNTINSVREMNSFNALWNILTELLC
jgi:hypothetical protein